jgi:hypothetical protein
MGNQMNENQLKEHNAAVEEMFQKIKPIIESYDTDVVLHTLMITLAACGNQLDLPAEHFKAEVVQELDRLMLVDKKVMGNA